MLYCFHFTTWWFIFYIQVFATDADSHQPLNIVYFLAGQGVDSADPATGNFAIDKTSGEIFVLKVGPLFAALCYSIGFCARVWLMSLTKEE